MTLGAGRTDGLLIDGGDLGCGELLMLVARQVRDLPPDSLVRLRTLDGGAPVEIPIWCRLTGHRFVDVVSDVPGDRTFTFRTRTTAVTAPTRTGEPL